MEANRQILDSTEGVSAQVPTVSRTNSPPPSELMGRYDLADNWCYTQVKITKFNYMWTINNFSFCREEMGEVIKSSCFSAASNNNLRWCLRINPKGLDEESKDYLSLYLLLVHCGSKTEVKAKFKFSILNAKREETKAMESQRAYRFVQGKDWGFKKFIRRDFLMDESNGLLPDDKLTIFCEVSVVGEMVNKSGQANVQAVKVPECHLNEDLGNLLERQQLTDVVLCVYAPVNKLSTNQITVNHSNINIMNNVGSEHDQICARLVNTLQSNSNSPGHILNNSNNTTNSNQYNSSYSFRQHFYAISGRVSSGLLNNSGGNFGMDCSSFHGNNYQHNMQQQHQPQSFNSFISPVFNPIEYHNNRQIGNHSANICSSSSSGLTGKGPRGRGGIGNYIAAVITLIYYREFHKRSNIYLAYSSDVLSSVPDNFNPGLASLVSKLSTTTKPGSTTHSNNVSTNINNNNNVCLGGPSSPSTSCQSLSYDRRVSHMNINFSNGNLASPINKNECKVNINSQKTDSVLHPEEPDDSSSNNSSDEVTNSTTGKSGISSSAVNSDSGLGTNQKALHSSCSSVHLNEVASKYEEIATSQNQATTTNNSNGQTKNLSSNNATNNMVMVREFEAHKAILAARSPVFSAMFEHGMEETRQNRVEITDLDPETVAEVLRYIYTGQVNNLDQLALSLLVAADKYQLDRLKSMCEESLVESLTVENACDVLSYADIYNAEQLRANAMEFVLTHALEICDTVAFYSMASKRPHLLAECFHGLASQQAPPLGPARKRMRQG